MAGIELWSAAFGDHTHMPERHAFRGGNTPPSLKWSGVPPEATELLVVAEDSDAPPAPFLHWLVTGIAPDVTGVEEGQTPSGARVWPNDFGELGWSGPWPAPGDRPHRYVFGLHALTEPPRLPANPTAVHVRDVVATALASGILVGLYQV